MVSLFWIEQPTLLHSRHRHHKWRQHVFVCTNGESVVFHDCNLIITSVSGYWLCPHSMWSRVYVAVRRPSVRLSVPSFDRSSGVRRVCCWAPCGQEISINSGGCRVTSPQHVAAPRHSAGNAGSAVFTAKLRRLNTDLLKSKLSCFVDRGSTVSISSGSSTMLSMVWLRYTPFARHSFVF